MKTHHVNLIFSILLVLLGLFGFFARYTEVGDFQFTALIPAFFGLVLLPMTPALKKENATVSHIVVMLTLIIGLFMVFMLIRESGFEYHSVRKLFIFTAILLFSIFAMAMYIRYFIQRRKERESQ